jgi:hypothetical protein
VPTPSDLPAVPPTHPDRDILYQLEDAVQKLAALPGDDWEWNVLRVGASGAKYVGAILEHREPIVSGTVFPDKDDSATAYGFHVLCGSALSLEDSEARSSAEKLFAAFDELGKIGLRLMNRSFVTDETDALCRGFSGYAADGFWLFFVAGLSQQAEGPVRPIPRVWQFESELELRTLKADDIRNLILQAAIPDLPKDWIESPPDDYFSFVFPAFGRTSVRVGRWLFGKVLNDDRHDVSRSKQVSRKQKQTAESVRCALVDWDSVENEEEIERALQTLEAMAAQVRDTLTTGTTEDPHIKRPLWELDERIRITATHPLHRVVESLLHCLPETEWHIDEAGNRMFRNDGGLWAALCDISRLPVRTPAEYIDKRVGMTAARQKFQQWIECRYMATYEAAQTESFLTRIRNLVRKQVGKNGSDQSSKTPPKSRKELPSEPPPAESQHKVGSLKETLEQNADYADVAAHKIHPATTEPPVEFQKNGRPIGPLFGTRTALGFSLHDDDDLSDFAYRKHFESKLANRTAWVRESTHSRKLAMFVRSFRDKDRCQERLSKFAERNPTQPKATEDNRTQPD